MEFYVMVIDEFMT